MSVRITIMPTTPPSLLFQSTRQTLINCQSMNNTRPSGGSRRSIVGRQSSYFIIQKASQLNVTSPIPGYNRQAGTVLRRDRCGSAVLSMLCNLDKISQLLQALKLVSGWIVAITSQRLTKT